VNVLLHTFGCKANQYDTEVVRQRLEAAGCRVVHTADEADAAVVNSCAVTHVGEAKLRAFVRRLGRRRPGMRTVVMGCAATLDDGRLGALPGTVSVVSGADVTAVERALGLGPGRPAPLRRFAGQARAWLKIQDGCDQRCTFCATALARGASRSRLPGEVAVEAALLAEHHAEIVLTGVHVGAYGRDLAGGWTLASLARSLVLQVPQVRFRLSSVEATELDEGLLALMVEMPDRLAPHLHAPLQSGSDRVLRSMGRRWYTATTYARRVEEAAARIRPLGLGADIIVGFPGETDADHRATVSLVRSLPFNYLHVFPFSPRAGTAAQSLSSRPAPEAVRERGAELRSLAEEREEAYRLARVGGRADLVLGAGRGAYREAVTEDYLSARVPAEEPWVAGRRRVVGRLALRQGALVAEAV